MATVSEALDSGEYQDGKTQGLRLKYHVLDAASYGAAMTALSGAVSSSVSGLDLSNLRVDPTDDTTTWIGYADYTSDASSGDIGSSSYNFEIGTQQIHVTHSKETIQKYAYTGQTATNFKRAIGVSWDYQNIEGTDVLIPTYSFSETHVLADSAVDSSYKAAIFGCAGKVNDATFKGFAAGEVLFLGATGSKSGADRWQIRFNFVAQQNVTGLTIPSASGDITGIAKKGWEYLWIKSVMKEDASASPKTTSLVPNFVYIERVYDSTSFSALGIGT